ncbi:1149_t:CDS:2 [Entrophospora sp. SA101]|nr:2184_t:CDS:2 [Entrophospora sp. SA101]CAJ0638026.1 3997_t:CDS:2 [Entrophospora sp. SA101]CAJ0759360.1 17151_t:CDS:2 [Entrophospora sp. SA101]CAJ0766053.1 1149_t:CDS:2 [Entrophospora sp. SA101]CAJ0839224.1 4057_t:CDS:2 [Entrophospora sp. SA101]
MSPTNFIFSTDYISPEVQAALPKGYTIRPLASDDYERGFLEVLKVLTTVGDISKDQFLERFYFLKTHNYEYFTLVIVSPEDRIVGAGTIFVERKFIRNTGLVGHIEDIAVDKNQQGKKLGLRIIQALKYIGAKAGCYKVILDCSEKVVRWAALVFGITYGFVHHRSLAHAEAKNKAIANYKHKEELISKAKAAYAAKLAEKSSKEVITNPDDPNFDLEKLLVHYGSKENH